MKKTSRKSRKVKLETQTVGPLVRELDNDSLAEANGGCSMLLPAVQKVREAAR